MIKKGLILAVATLFAIGHLYAQSGKQVTFTGKVKFPDPTGKHKIYLGKYVGKGIKKVYMALDSAQLNADSTFTFKINTEKPDFYQVKAYSTDRIDFWADKDNLNVSIKGIDTARGRMGMNENPPYIYMEGASANNELINDVKLAYYLNYQNMIVASHEQYEAGLSKDSLWINYMKNWPLKIGADFNIRLKYIIHKYSDQPAVLFALNYLNPNRDGDLLMSTIDNLIDKYPWLTQAKVQKQEILDNMAQTKKIANGMPAPHFSFPDINGKKYSPEDFKGDYTILEFWASWCGPCRQEIPHIKEVYNKYKSKGLKILSISIDVDKSHWKKALDEEKMPWSQVIAQESKPIMASYLFGGVPYMVVLDKEGRIIEKNVRGESLDAAMKKIFGF